MCSQISPAPSSQGDSWKKEPKTWSSPTFGPPTVRPSLSLHCAWGVLACGNHVTYSVRARLQDGGAHCVVPGRIWSHCRTVALMTSSDWGSTWLDNLAGAGEGPVSRVLDPGALSSRSSRPFSPDSFNFRPEMGFYRKSAGACLGLSQILTSPPGHDWGCSFSVFY